MRSGSGWLLLLAGLACATQARAQAGPPLESIPNPRATHNGWVTDAAGVLGASAAEIEALLGTLNRERGAEVAVVILPSIGTAVPKPFATSLFNYWKVGRVGHNDGVLVLQVLDQRRVEIETGYGEEGALPDAKCAWLIRDVATPRFRSGDIAGGQLALARGIAYAIRTPDASHDAVVGAALGEALARPAAISGTQAFLQEPSHATPIPKWYSAVALLCGLALLGGVWLARRSARAALYRHSAIPPAPQPPLLLIALCMIAFVMFFAFVALGGEFALWSGSGSLLVVAGLFARNTWQTFARARARYAPRKCSTCGGPLSLVSDAVDDALLQGGRGVEERLGAVNYDVWKCACGKLSVEEFEVSPIARRCHKCHFRTGSVTRSQEVERATTSSTGLRRLYLKCENCQAEYTEDEVIPQISTSSDGSSGSSSSSSGGGGSSFGGGSSGGGGAGGSY